MAGCLPALSPSHEPCGVLRPEIAGRYGFPEGDDRQRGGGDNMMGAIGTGNVVPGAVTASFGTSGTIYAFSRKPVVDPSGEIAAFCSSTGGWLPLLCTMNVTGVTEQVRALFGWSLADLERAAAGAPAGSDGLTLLPYLDGERTPNLPRGTGVYFGLDRRTLAQGHLARAAIEGATLGMNYGLRRLSVARHKAEGDPAHRRRRAVAALAPGRRGRLRGPGCRDGAGRERRAWRRPSGRLVRLARPRLGAALAELCARSVSVDESTRCVPDRKRAALYRRRQQFQDRLCAATSGARSRRADGEGRQPCASATPSTRPTRRSNAISKALGVLLGTPGLGRPALQRGAHEHDAGGRTRRRRAPASGR